MAVMELTFDILSYPVARVNGLLAERAEAASCGSRSPCMLQLQGLRLHRTSSHCSMMMSIMKPILRELLVDSLWSSKALTF
jgi:hypothetical protein